MEYKKLEDYAVVDVGQILPRVTDDSAVDGEKTLVLSPKAIVDGIIVKDDFKETYVIKPIGKEKYTKEGDVVIKLSSPYDAAYIEKEYADLLIPSFIAVVRVGNSKKVDARYLVALFNSRFIRDQLQNLQVGAARPMIRISELRAIDIPVLDIEDMQRIGEEYALSCEKRSILAEMIDTERSIMEYTLIKSAMGE